MLLGNAQTNRNCDWVSMSPCLRFLSLSLTVIINMVLLNCTILLTLISSVGTNIRLQRADLFCPKIIDSSIENGYKEYQLTTSLLLCIFLLVVNGTQLLQCVDTFLSYFRPLVKYWFDTGWNVLCELYNLISSFAKDLLFYADHVPTVSTQLSILSSVKAATPEDRTVSTLFMLPKMSVFAMWRYKGQEGIPVGCVSRACADSMCFNSHHQMLLGGVSLHE